MEVGQYGLMRVTCFLACRLELDAVAGLRWISWCVLGWGTDFSVFFFSIFVFLPMHTACCKHEAVSCLIYLSPSNEAVFGLGGKKPPYTGVPRGCHNFICLSVNVCVRRFF